MLDKGCEPKVLAINFRLDSLFFRKTKLIEQLYHEMKFLKFLKFLKFVKFFEFFEFF